jgi:hypothetical protein
MNNITLERKSSAVANNNANPFTVYGEQISQRNIVGQLLRFSKGDFLAGQEDEQVPEGTEFIANMDEMLAGWIRWENNRPTDHVMGKVSDGYQPPHRKELGDTDKAQWEIDFNNQQRDPWQFSNYLLLKTTHGSGELFTFTTSSRGGLNALGELCKVYGGAMAQRPNDYPVIALFAGSYDHPNRAFGRIKYPIFKIVGWKPKTAFANSETMSSPPAEEEPAPKKAKPRL